jgi:lipoprotein-anchoring transpeptidase ErfK/SrfK
VIAFQSWEGLARDGIAGPVTRAALASARRPKPRATGGRRIEVFREKGVALLVKDGRTKRAVHVSTGAPGYATPAGSFSVFRKERMSWSVPFSQWLPWASYFFQGIAFHEYASVPTYPASHGCVRVPEPEARYLYRFADVGLRVVVF